MDKKRIILGVIVVWLGLCVYWYICKIKGQCQQTTSGDKVEVISADSTPTPSLSQTYSVYFEPNKASYLEVAKVDGELQKYADLLKNNTSAKAVLTGFTANLGKTAGYNQMSLARANVIKQKLVKMGAKADQITVAAKGVEGTSTASEADKAKSRRVELVISQ